MSNDATTENLEQSNVTSLDLGNSTLDEIIQALIEGRKIELQDKSIFTLDNKDARQVLNFYSQRRDLWPQSKQVTAPEVESILTELASPMKSAISGAPHVKPGKEIWRLTRIEAHRFAGLHRHCDTNGKAPDILSLPVEQDVTCISGFNGAGKTALQSSILWCLTGKALRSQHLPDEIHEPIAVEVAQESPPGQDDEKSSSINIPPIVPLPSAKDLIALSERPAYDTWVQLSFKNSSGKVVQVKRELVFSGKGKASTKLMGLDELGISTLAIEAGTLMPAIASHMRFDEKTTFAAAIAQLTGLKPLADFGTRAVRLAKRLEGDEVKRADQEKNSKLTEYTNKKQTLLDAWTQKQETFGSLPDLPFPSEEIQDRSCKAALSKAKAHLESIRENSQKDVQSILGSAPQLTDANAVTDFLANLNEAQESMGSASLGSLPSIATTQQLGAIDQNAREETAKLVHSISSRAESVVTRLRDKAKAARWQLYAAVAQWHKEHHGADALSACPICGTDLDTVPNDAIADKKVKEALTLSLEADADATKGAQDWQRDVARELLDTLPQTVRIFADTQLTQGLLELYQNGYVVELMALKPFNGHLSPLKASAKVIWSNALEDHSITQPTTGLFAQPTIELPIEFKNSQLAKRIENVQSAIRLSQLREECASQIKSIALTFFGSNNVATNAQTPEAPNRRPLRDQVTLLRQAIEASDPILSALRQLSELEAVRVAWVNVEDRRQLLIRAAAAVTKFTQFPGLVRQQVEGLIEGLEKRTVHWLDLLYKPHYLGGPSYASIDPTQERGVGLNARMGNLRIPAHQVMNSSQLRACVWAFLFSLWEHIRERTGGLTVMLLDDPQTHFDPINTENLAAVIPQLVDAGMTPIVTSNDMRFIAAIRDKLPKLSTSSPTWTVLQISPVSSSRTTMELVPSLDEVFERRKAWLADENNATLAQEFVERVRAYIENRIWDLLAGDPTILHKPTLADLINSLSGARTSGELPFNEKPFENLLTNDALKTTSSFYKIINKAHHDLRNVTPAEAKEVSDRIKDVDHLIRSCSAAYARFMGRLTRHEEDLFYANAPTSPTPLVLSNEPLSVIGSFSAKSYVDTLALDQVQENFTWQNLGDVAFYGIRGASLGTLALPGQIAIASLTHEPQNGGPVIALSGTRVLARRFHIDKQDLSRIALTCDQSGKENVGPAVILQKNKVRVLPVVGILYDKLSSPSGDEAQPINACSLLSRKLMLARIVDDSAYPVIRSGDSVLLEEMSMPSSATLEKMRGDLVAFLLSQHDQTYAYLKRVGAVVTDDLRIFENVGATGDSIVIKVSSNNSETNGDTPALIKIWQVHGVLRTKI